MHLRDLNVCVYCYVSNQVQEASFSCITFYVVNYHKVTNIGGGGNGVRRSCNKSNKPYSLLLLQRKENTFHV